MFNKKKEGIKEIVDEKTKEIGEKATVAIACLVVATSLSIGYIVGALSSAILLKSIKGME